MTIIRVQTKQPYDVTIQAGSSKRMHEALAPWKQRAMFLVTDVNVYALYKERLETILADGWNVTLHVVSPGENSKSPIALAEIWEAMAGAALRRDAVLVAFGGGVVGDLGGFAAASYLRGIDFIQWPTTLLAAVDSSVGGKTGINLSAGKNLAGAFHQPKAVFFDPEVLADLPAMQTENGMAEIIKTAVLFDRSLFETLESGPGLREPEQVVAACVRHKARVVCADETEQGERKQLNLGHTFGHAIERALDYALPHGHAVSVGLAMMARACARRGLCKPETANRIEETLRIHGLPVHTEVSNEVLLPYLMVDKKTDATGATLVTIEDIGHCALRKIAKEEMVEWLEEGR